MHPIAVPLSAAGVRVIESASPQEFDGPVNQWSPEGLLTAAVADCFLFGFRAIATASKFPWTSLDVRTEGTLNRIDGKMRFTQFHTHAKLTLPAVPMWSAPGSAWKRQRPAAWPPIPSTVSGTAKRK